MRVVHSGDPQRIPAAPDFHGFVQKDRESIPLEVQRHFQGIVIPKDAPAVRRQRLAEVRHGPCGGTMVAFHAIPVVPCENRRVVRGLMDQINHDRHQGGFQVAVQVGEMQEAKSLEGRREIRKKPFLFLETNIQKIRPHPLFEAREVQDAREPEIERQEAFDAKNSVSLMQELRKLVVLPLQPLGVKLIAQAVSERGHSLGGMDQGFLTGGGVA
jgi:hypothetical protein